MKLESLKLDGEHMCAVYYALKRIDVCVTEIIESLKRNKPLFAALRDNKDVVALTVQSADRIRAVSEMMKPQPLVKPETRAVIAWRKPTEADLTSDQPFLGAWRHDGKRVYGVVRRDNGWTWSLVNGKLTVVGKPDFVADFNGPEATGV